MNPVDLIHRASRAGVELYLEDDQLKFRARGQRLQPELRAELKAHKAELIAFLKQHRDQPVGPEPRPELHESAAPLTQAQQQLFYLYQLAGPSSEYTMATAWQLEGLVASAVLETALRSFLQRHPVLRSVVLLDQGTPIQRPQPLKAFQLERKPLAPGERLTERLAKEARHAFVLERQIPFRALLLEGDTGGLVLLFLIHHIAFDGASYGVMLRELAELTAGRPLPEPALQVSDIARWQAETSNGGIPDRSLTYWDSQLNGVQAFNGLPADRPRTPNQSYQPASLTRPMEASLAESVRRFAEQQGVSLFACLQTAFSLLVAHWSGRDEAVTGTPISARQDPRLKDAIGLFITTAPIRVRLADDPRLVECVQQVQQRIHEAIAHHAVPLDRLVTDRITTRDPAFPPLIQMLFSVEEGGGTPLELAGTQGHPVTIPRDNVNFELELNLREAGQTFEVDWGYAGNLFDTATIETLNDSYLALLRNLVERPELRLSELSYCPPSSLAAIENWNHRLLAVDPDQTFIDRFKYQVEATPEASACLDENRVWSYRELDRLSDCQARRLKAEGVQSGDRVGLCVRPGMTMVLGLLSVLKARAAYIPLDPDYPQARLEQVLAASRPKVILGDAAPIWMDHVLPFVGELTEGDWSTETLPNPQPTDLAYIIFTSGTTGVPKGVMVDHGNLNHFLAELAEVTPLHPGDRITLLTALSFDVHVVEVQHALASGATVIALPDSARRDPTELADCLNRFEVNHAHATPATWQMLVDAGWRSPRPMTLYSGGDALSVALKEALLGSHPGHRLWNYYGPTEASVYIAAHELHRESRRVTIGRPLPNQTFAILDANGHPQPIGVPGELYLSGPNLARGYLNQPELTAERFIVDPETGHRCYRTGDLARWLPNGEVEVLGRLDFQIKLNGHRIELEDIEQALVGHAEVDAAAVVLNRTQGGHKQLLGFVTSQQSDSSALPDQLRQFLRDRLPAYMVPHRLEVLPALPLTANRKVDRRALLELAPSVTGSALGRPPRPGLERKLADIWAPLLGAEPADAERSFFELGGHSLLAIKMLAQVEAHLAVKVTLRTLLAAPSISALAGHIESRNTQPLKSGSASGVDWARYRRENASDAPASDAQRSLWTLDTFNTHGRHYTFPLALALTGPLDRGKLAEAMHRLGERHAALRTRFVLVDGDLRQQLNAQTAIDWAVHDLTATNEPLEVQRELGRELEQELFEAPFDLSSGPLFRAALVILGEQRHRLLLAGHHIILDGWSASVLMRDLAALYEGRTADLPALPLQFADVCRWQREQTQGADFEARLTFWRERLRDAPVVHNLPLDKPRPGQPSFTGATWREPLPKRVSARLQGLVQQQGTTAFTLAFASTALLLGRHSGSDDLVLGTPVANRPDPVMADVVGYFANVLPLRARIDAEASFRDFLTQCHQDLFAAFEHQDVPFDRIVEAVNPPRSLSHTPLFQIMVTVEEGGSSPAGLGTAAIEEQQPETVSAKYDLSLAFSLEDGRWVLNWTYATELFEADTIRLLSTHLAVLLGGIADNAERKLGDLPLMSGEEQRQLQRYGQGPALEYDPTHGCVQRFEDWTKRQPEAPAIRDGDETLTYAQLDRRAQTLAARLAEGLTDADTPIGICLPRSAGFIVAQLAVMKLGRPFVSIDPAAPAGRLQQILEDVEAAALVVQASAPKWDAPNLSVVALETELSKPDSAWVSPPAVEPDTPAYIVFTSGSTGRPKGAVGTHRGLINMILGKQQRFGLRPGSVMTVSANVAFDSVLWEIWPTLTGGGTLVINRDQVLSDPLALEAQLARFQPTHFWLPTGLMETLAGLDFAWPDSLQYVCTGGDRLSGYCLPPSVRAEFHNIYGPSECSVWATCHRVEPDDVRTPSIGGPLPNMTLSVRDDAQRLLPLGAVGEICIGGDGVGLGYHRRPELTQAAFLPDPDAGSPSGRLYRTGDLGRWRPDGTLECLGRRDSQVKIRGFRVELEEINRQLLAFDDIGQAFTHVIESGSGKRLVSFVVADHPVANSTPDRWLAQLAETLPNYMLPGAIHLLDSMPLTPNGKVDRRRLEAWLAEQPTPDQVNTASPRDQLELTLYGIWRSILLTPHIGIGDAFFDVGGSSIAAIKVIAAINEALGTRLAASELLHYPTIEQLAGRIRTGEGRRPSAGRMIELKPGDGGAHLVCIHPAGGTAFCYLSLARCLPNKLGVFGLQAPGVSPGEAFLPDLTAMAEHHLTSIRPLLNRPLVLAGASFGGLLGFEMVRLLHQRGHQAVSLVMLDTEGTDDEALLARIQPVSAEVFRDKLVRYNGMYPGIEDAQIDQYHRLYNHHLQVQRCYRASENGGRVVLIQATDDTTAEERREGARYWQRYVTGQLVLEPSPGTHASMLESPAVDIVADIVAREALLLSRPLQKKESLHEPS